jgi:hypothetical protein
MQLNGLSLCRFQYPCLVFRNLRPLARAPLREEVPLAQVEAVAVYFPVQEIPVQLAARRQRPLAHLPAQILPVGVSLGISNQRTAQQSPRLLPVSTR